MRDFFHGVGKILTGPEGPAHDAIDNARMAHKRKMIATMDCITGALKLAMLPAGSRKREFSGIRAAKRPTSRKMSTQEATAKERFSWGVMGSWRLRKHRYPRQGAGLAAPRFGDMFRHPPANKDDGEGGGKGKEIIAQDVHFIRRVNELSRHLGEALNDGINGRRRVSLPQTRRQSRQRKRLRRQGGVFPKRRKVGRNR